MARKLVSNPIKRHVSQVLKRADFSAVGADGTIDFNTKLPAGAIVQGWTANVTKAFIGDTSAVVKVGIAGGLANYSARSDKSVFTTGKKQAASAPATSDVDALTTPRVTVTSGLAFSSVTQGEMVITIYYLDAFAKPI